MYRFLTTLAATLALLNLATADCQLQNGVNPDDPPTIETRQELCLPQGEGAWTFSLTNSQISFPTFDGDNALAGVAGSYTWLMYDNTCTLRGAYGSGDNDCGTPFVIMENFLPYVLSITDVSLFLGGEWYAFLYGDGLYEINENHCLCQDMSDGLRGATGCRCAFPVDGTN